MTRRRRRPSTPLAILAGACAGLMLSGILNRLLPLAAAAAVIATAAAVIQVRRFAPGRPARQVTRRVVQPYCPNRDCPTCYPSATPAAMPAPAPAAKPADRPLSDIDPTDPDAAEAVRRNLRRRAAGRAERIDPPAPGPERRP
jgi:hypothetical protein